MRLVPNLPRMSPMNPDPGAGTEWCGKFPSTTSGLQVPHPPVRITVSATPQSNTSRNSGFFSYLRRLGLNIPLSHYGKVVRGALLRKAIVLLAPIESSRLLF